MKTRSKLFDWLGLIIVALSAFAMVAVPVFLIQPFAPQTARDLSLSFALKSWSPLMTIVEAVLAVGMVFWLWRNTRHWWSKAFLILPLFIVLFCVWFARQNHFEWMFNPLANSSYAKVDKVDFVGDGDMVMAVEINGESAAYPVRLMAYHHIVEDRAGGVAIAATY